MNEVFLLTGGNLGDRMHFLHQAKYFIEKEVGKIVTHSCTYETAPWGSINQSAFLNQVLRVATHLKAEDVLKTILTIEIQLGRLRYEKMGPRTIDIDILYFNKEIVNQPHLIIPHPHIQNRRFVLTPLVEIAPDFLHPVLQKTNLALLQICNDELPVVKFDEKQINN